jgi:hypothetical protein
MNIFKIKELINSIDEYFVEDTDLFNTFKNDAPDKYQTAYAALFLQKFYNGLENILKDILKQYKNAKFDNRWHSNLLDEAFSDKETVALLDVKYKDKLVDYMKFRHFLVHYDDDNLKLEKLTPLINDVKQIWNNIKSDIYNYIDKHIENENKLSATPG